MADPKNPKEPISAKASAGEEDKVAAAYENISKKLESLRNGEEVEDEEESDEAAEDRSDESNSEEELEEWKGPKPMKNPEIPEGEDEEEEVELRKVKLRNLEEDDEATEATDVTEATKDDESDDDEEEDEEEIEVDAKSMKEDESEEIEDRPRKNWEPKENDPLDEEENEEVTEGSKATKVTEDGKEDEKDEDEEPGMPERNKFDETEVEAEIPVRKSPQPDTLDDLTEDRPGRREEEEDDYFIPNLKGTGQSSHNMGYNTPIERELSGESYQKSSMDTNDPNNFFSQHNQPQPPKRASKFHLLILVVIGVVVIGFTVYILKGGFGELSLTAKPSPSPSPVESPSPTPTPTPEPDRAQYKLRVLNGSGKTGLAASVSARLKDLGYQTEKTGNATNSAFTQTIVRVKPSLESFIPQIVKDLTPDFDAAGNTSLKDTDAVDIEIILGAK